MDTLHILYDETCGFCVRCAHWLQAQPALVPLTCLAAGGEEARQRFPRLRREGRKQELVVVDAGGGVYRDADAWLMCLWALAEWRGWALRLSSPALRPFARNLYEVVSQRRHRLSALLGLTTDAALAQALAQEAGAPGTERCAQEGACRLQSCAACGNTLAPGRTACPHCLAEVLQAVSDA